MRMTSFDFGASGDRVGNIARGLMSGLAPPVETNIVPVLLVAQLVTTVKVKDPPRVVVTLTVPMI